MSIKPTNLSHSGAHYSGLSDTEGSASCPAVMLVQHLGFQSRPVLLAPPAATVHSLRQLFLASM